VKAHLDTAVPLHARSRIRPAVRQILGGTVGAIEALPEGVVASIAQAVVTTHRLGGTVYVFGNGGSASTAEHFVCDLSKAARTAGGRPLSLVAPTANSSLLTALANDSSYPDAFAEQLEGAITDIDLAIAISASGNSPNVLRAVDVARRSGAFTIGLTGFGGGRLESLVDIALVVDSHDYGVVENAHLVVEHAVTAAFVAALRAKSNQTTSEGLLREGPEVTARAC
jgi:D-sedoheptulose 7-phosphate isomerase